MSPHYTADPIISTFTEVLTERIIKKIFLVFQSIFLILKENRRVTSDMPDDISDNKAALDACARATRMRWIIKRFGEKP